MKPLVGDFNIPLTGCELLFQLSNGVPVQIGRAFLSKALLLVERCTSAEIDVQTDGGEAYLTPRRCELNDEGKAYIANNGFVQVTAKEIDGSIGRYHVYTLASCPGYWFLDAENPIARNVKVQP